MKAYLRIATLLSILLPCILGSTAMGQQTKKSIKGQHTQRTLSSTQEAKDFDFTHYSTPNDGDFVTIYSDTIEVTAKDKVRTDSILNPMHVVTNSFGRNWFAFATAGAHTFRGDYSNTSDFMGTVTPDWGVGIGKWFTPGLALKLEFIKGDSKGYTEYLTGHYGYGIIDISDKNGHPFRKMKTGWWDISGAVLINITRMFCGYEGYDSPKHMNQVMAALGFGGVHHTGFEKSHSSDNEWSGHIELQYSRFFTRAKRFSLDLKARGIFYQTNFDLEYGVNTYTSNKWDMNVGLDLGFTFYLGHKRADGWGTSVTQIYERDYTQRDILVYREREVHLPQVSDFKPGKLVNLTFYVFYPNNYSGRNDAPVVPDAQVNAIEYLLGGVYTQQKYTDNNRVTSLLQQGGNPRNENVVDIPTVSPLESFNTNGLPRGYEMECAGEDRAKCLSYSTVPRDMLNYMSATGYCYAPIWDGLHEWGYRIDKETYRQQLLSSANYRDTETYGLNAHSGLKTVNEYLRPEESDVLVSFADVYAALNGNTGFISNYTNPEVVDMISKLFQYGQTERIESHGVATSQDNFTGRDADNVGFQRNSDLANYRAETVRKWLANDKHFKDASTLVYIDNVEPNTINRVADPSTRGLSAKTNRYVKVRLQIYVPEEGIPGLNL